MDWIVGLANARRPADTDQALEYVRSGYSPKVRQLVVARADTLEYLNLFLAADRSMLFWMPALTEPPRLRIARFPGRPSLPDEEVVFAGRTAAESWWVPARDTIRRLDGLALLEEFICQGPVSTELPAWAVAHRQLVLPGFEDAVPPDQEFRTVAWEVWG